MAFCRQPGLSVCLSHGSRLFGFGHTISPGILPKIGKRDLQGESPTCSVCSEKGRDRHISITSLISALMYSRQLTRVDVGVGASRQQKWSMYPLPLFQPRLLRRRGESIIILLRLVLVTTHRPVPVILRVATSTCFCDRLVPPQAA